MKKKSSKPFAGKEAAEDAKIIPPQRATRRPEPEPEEEMFPSADATDEMLRNLCEEYSSGDLRIEVSKVNDKTNNLERVGKYTYPGEFDPDIIAEKFGGGKYRYVVKDEHGVICKKFTINYAQQNTASAQGPANDLNNKVIELMQQRLADNEAKSKDSIAQMTTIFTMMMQMVKENNATTMSLLQGKKDPLEDMLKWKQIFGGDDALGKLDKLLGVFQTGANIGKEYGKNEDAGSGGLLETLATAAAALLAGRNPAAAGPGKLDAALTQIKETISPERRMNPAVLSPESVTPEVIPAQPPEAPASAEEQPVMTATEYILGMVGQNIPLLKMQSSHLPPESAAKMLGQLFAKDDAAWDMNIYFRKTGISDIMAAYPELHDIEPWLRMTVAEYVKLFEPKPKPEAASAASAKPEPKPEVKPEEKIPSKEPEHATDHIPAAADPASDGKPDAAIGA